MKQIFFFRFGLLILLSLGCVVFASADESTDDVSEQDYACSQALMEEIPPVINNYEDFLNEYFQVDTPTSEQFEYALQQYRFTSDTIQASYLAHSSLTDITENKSVVDASDEFKDCTFKRDVYLNYTKSVLRKQILGSTASKVTFKVIDGFKAMNQDLDDLQDVFHQTFPVLFVKMSNALPCYARSCVSP